MNMNQIARICHEVNRAYCQALGDDTQPSWEEAPDWQRSSARMGVDLHSMGDFGPEASHISWMKQKLSEGWVYGKVKNPEAKEHPCIVAFHDLPREQQAKDFIFRAVVHAINSTKQMDFNEYQAAALRTAKPDEDTLAGNLVHASLGLATETDKFTTEVKRIARYGKPMTEEMRQRMMEELGDTLWYIALAAKALDTTIVALAAKALDTTIEKMALDNIAKLQLRFPDKFSNEAAEARADKAGQSVEQERHTDLGLSEDAGEGVWRPAGN